MLLQSFEPDRLFGINIGSVLGGVGGFLIGGPAGAAAGSKLVSSLTKGKQAVSTVPGFIPPAAVQKFGGILGAFGVKGFNGGTKTAAACPEGFELDARGRCARTGLIGTGQRLFPGGETGFAFGEAEVGRFGAGLQPFVRESSTRICPRGSVLGIDGLCYNKRDLRNTDRFWPQGRRPLLTGGEMRCITVASRAANKLRTKTKQLQKLGMLPKPTRRTPARRQIAAGHHAHVAHD